MPTTRVAFDARPLTDPVDRPAAREYTRRLRAAGALSIDASAGFTIAIGAVVAVVFLAVLVPAVLSSVTRGGSGVVLLLPVIALVGVVVWLVVAAETRTVRRWRLGRFAEANRMTYAPVVPDPGLPGMIFSLGSSRRATDVLSATEPRRVDYANYEYTTGSGKNRTTHRWGYVAIRLDVPLPNIVLDATSNNGFFGSNLPAHFDRDQRLKLEGDFDEHFALYCPEGYERDALYLFTPDIMARFIDNAAALDVEIVDDRMFLYAKRDFSTLDPATWEWLFSIVAALDDKFAQWARWRDERLATAEPVVPAAAASAPGAAGSPGVPASVQLLRPPPGVAPEGRRLRHGVRWTTIAIIAVLALYWLASAVFQFGR